MIIGFVVYLILSQAPIVPYAETRLFKSMKECEETMQRMNDTAAVYGVRVIYSKCLQEN